MAPVQAIMRVVRRFGGNRYAFAGAALLLAVIVGGAAASLVFPGDPLRIVGPPLIWPFQNPRFPLGTDAVGRDMLAMIAYGARTTLMIGVAASLTAMAIGVTVGSLAGFYGGVIGNLFSRLIELFQTVPSLIFIMVVVSFFNAKLVFVVLAIGFVSWESIARLTRAEVMAWRSRDFIQACRGIGMSDVALVFGEILPNALAPVIAVSTLSIASAILVESGLSFLDLSDPTVSTWGRLVGDGKELIRSAWYISALPGLAIILTVVALGLVSDGLNEMFNPRVRRR